MGVGNQGRGREHGQKLQCEDKYSHGENTNAGVLNSAGVPNRQFLHQRSLIFNSSLWCFNINTYVALKIQRHIQPNVGNIWEMKKSGWFSVQNKEVSQVEIILKEQD